MKQKYKSPEMMKDKGVDFHLKLLKKTVKEMIGAEEKLIEPFFYDTEFDFANGQDPHPVLFIGEIPAKWKKYMKANKASKSFAYGNCIIDEDGQLKMQVKVGKGGKDMVLKKVNKLLLKPFTKAYFVEEIAGDAAVYAENVDLDATEVKTDNAAVEDTNINDLFENWSITAKNFLQGAGQALEHNLNILSEFEKPISDLKNIIVTDTFIEKAMAAKKEVKNLNAYLVNLNNLIKSGKSYQGQSDAADALIDLLEKQVEQIESNQVKVDAMLKSMEGLKQISNPRDAEIPIIDDDPIINFLTRVKKAY